MLVKPYKDIGVALLLGAMAVTCAWVYRQFTQDDAYITYRFARNLADGYGFVYNVGEPVLGTSTPLYTLVLALGSKLSGRAVDLVSRWISLVSLWLGGVVLYDLEKGEGRLPAASAALIFITNPVLVTSIGMETFFLNLLLLSCLKSYADRHFTLTGLLLGCLVLTRY